MTTFVLVHGAWHGGWCYRAVASRLRAQGHEVYTPTLTGVGERSHLLTGTVNLSTHIADIVNVLKWEELTDVVLAGHSYGGMVITGVADAVPERIRSLVYLDAFVPENGQSLWSQVPDAYHQMFMQGAAASGGYAIPPIPAEVFNLIPERRAWVDRQCTPQPFAAFRQSINLSGACKKVSKHTYVYAAEWAATPFKPYLELYKADPAWTTHSLACGHDVMVDMPDEVASILIAAQ